MYKSNIIISVLVLSALAWGNPFTSENPFAIDKNIKKIEQEEGALLQSIKQEQKSIAKEEEELSDSNTSDKSLDSEINASEKGKKSVEIEEQEQEKVEPDLEHQAQKDQEKVGEGEQYGIVNAEEKKAGQPTVAAPATATAETDAPIEKQIVSESNGTRNDTNISVRSDDADSRQPQETMGNVQDKEAVVPAETKKASKKKRDTKKKKSTQKRRVDRKKKYQKKKRVHQKHSKEKEVTAAPENVKDSTKRHKTAEEVLQEAIRGVDD